jgi:putative hemolysin
VYEGSVEATLGVLTLRDLLGAVARGDALDLRSLLRPALFVPEAIPITDLLRQLHQNRRELALVVDEYGGVVGLVTVEDVVDEIVGEIRADVGHAAELFTRLPDGSVVVDGMTPIDEIRRHLGIRLPESHDYTTVAGLLLATMHTVPARGASAVIAGRRWTVLEMEGPRIRRVSVRPETGPSA